MKQDKTSLILANLFIIASFFKSDFGAISLLIIGACWLTLYAFESTEVSK